MLRPLTRLKRLAARRALLAAAILLAVVRDPSEGSGPVPRAERNQPWRTGRPTPIAVAGGRARFTPSGRWTLVIASSLARSAGTFPIRLTSRPIPPETCRPPESPFEAADAPSPPRLTGPTLPPIQTPVETPPPLERTFHLMVRDGDVASASNYRAVTGRLAAVGQRVQVYIDVDDRPSVRPELLRDVVDTFDARVFPVAARTIGQARDIDGDGRFTVFLSSWLSRLAGGRHAVDGFVRGADLDPTMPAPFSNHGDMMYLSTAMGPGAHLRTVIAHEYTHAVTFCARSSLASDEEGWLDEAVAHLVEDLHGFSRTNLDYRVSAFLSQPEKYRLVVDDYYAADLFRSHGNRGGTYLFLRWCADRYGAAFLPALVGSGRRGVANLETVTGVRFEELYRAWSVALFLSGMDPALGHADGYRSLTVRGPFDDWELAGPRTIPVAPGGPAAEWASAGTASRYLIVGPSPTGASEVEVAAPVEADLQVTAVPLPDDLAHLELGVETNAAGLRFQLRETAGTSVRLSSLAWEPLVPDPDSHTPGFRHAALDQFGIASAFGASALAANGRIASKPLPARDTLPAGRALVFKAVGTDARGRRVSAWADHTPQAGEPQPRALSSPSRAR